MKTQLVIMAAGIGSRYQGGIKQIERLGPHGELIIDYSINYAQEAGFDEVVFIIRKDIEEDFKEVISDRISEFIKCKFAYQEMDKMPEKYLSSFKDRTKPLGTAHALLCAKDIIDSPFCIINADDYYGKEGFKKIHNYLMNINTNADKFDICMAGFFIKNTLSKYGTVTRGICKKDDNDLLTSIHETYEIKKENGIIKGLDEDKNEVIIDENSSCSMNMWGISQNIFDVLENKFITFLDNHKCNMKAEFLLPSVIDELIKENKATVKVLDVQDKWFGVTYKEDGPIVKEELAKIGPLY